MGTAQHSHGAQNIRSYAILQLLLGNIGVAGGGRRKTPCRHAAAAQGFARSSRRTVWSVTAAGVSE
jgi:anaerobic selenocysteine-containing dehydrogenase